MPPLVEVEPIAMLPTQAGCAAFLSDGKKTILMYIDPAVGAALSQKTTDMIARLDALKLALGL